jgi:hypothetical protein
MEKPVRIVENEKIHNFNEKVRSGLEHALNFMMGGSGNPPVQISFFEPFLMPIEAYIQAYKKQSVLIKIHSDHDFQGELYWFFEMKTAILLGAMLRMVPTSSLEEKLAKGEFDALDQDSFGEVGNQLCGILDRAFRTLTQKNIHLKMDFNKVIYPSSSIGPASFVNREEYVVLLSTVTIPNHGGQKLTLLLPRSLYEVMLNLEISLAGITPKKVVVHSWSGQVLEKTQLDLNSRRTVVVPSEKPEDIFTLADQSGVAAVGIDLKRLNFPLKHQDTIFLKRLAANKNITRLPYFLTWEKATEDEVKEVAKLGLHGASVGPFAENFARWAQAFTEKTE